MSKARKTTQTLIAAPVIIIVLILAVWAYSYWQTGDNVARNVQLVGAKVGGSSQRQLDAKLTSIAEQISELKVEIRTPEVSMDSTAQGIGVALDSTTTRSSVMAVGRSGDPLSRPIGWIKSLFSPREVSASLKVDVEVLSPALVKLEGDRRVEPVDPKLEANADGVSMVPGQPGSSITIGDIVAALPANVSTLSKPIKIDVKPTKVPTRTSDEEIKKLVDTANRITEGPLTLTYGDKKAEVPGKEFRPTFVLHTGGDGVQLAMEDAKVAEILAKHTSPSANPTGVRFDIVNGIPTPVGGEDAQVCCGPEAPHLIVEALLKGEKSVALPFRTVTAAQGREWAAGLGVKEVIGSFTTKHAAGQSRVTNIHRIADLMRGVLIAPDQTISVNGIVGKRTTEKGFVSGGVILDGKHTDDVGGGVSQFATTMFNAAFFAGLDIPEYKAHSEYLSRYPFGREATLWYPGVDLKVHNNTPFGVVVWTSYTATTITVQMWSTRFVSGDQTAQSPTSGCGRITTTRTRTYVDGRTEDDKFHASYKCG